MWYTLVGLAAPGQLLLAIEANRHGSSGLLAWYTFFAVVLQVCPPVLGFTVYRVPRVAEACSEEPSGPCLMQRYGLKLSSAC